MESWTLFGCVFSASTNDIWELLQDDEWVFHLREHWQVVDLFVDRLKGWIKVARGRFSSAAGQRAQDEKLESPSSLRRQRYQVEIHGEGHVMLGPAQQGGAWVEEGGQRRQSARLARGRFQTWKGELEQLLFDKITTLGKPRAKCFTSIHPVKGTEQGARWPEKAADDRQQGEEEMARKGLGFCASRGQRQRRAVDLDPSGDLGTLQQ